MDLATKLSSMLGTSDIGEQQQEPDALTKKLQKLTQSTQDKNKKLGIYDDADSGDGYRIQGFDAPEIYHGDTQERKKDYEQIAYANGLTKDQAKQVVDEQSDAYKVDQDYRNSGQYLADKLDNPDDPYYQSDSLGKYMLDQRDAGNIQMKDMTAFDIYGAGEKATDEATRWSQGNGGSALTDPNEFATDEDKKGYYGRRLLQDPKFSNHMIESGYGIPSANTQEEYDQRQELYDKSKDEKSGLNAGYGKKVLQAMSATSYSTKHFGVADQASKLADKMDAIDRIINTGKAISSSAAGTVVDIANGVGYLTGLYDIDEEGVKRKIDSTIGYDVRYSAKTKKEVMDVAGKAIKAYQKGKDIPYTDIAKAAWDVATTPEMYGELMGFIVTSAVAEAGVIAGVLKYSGKMGKATKLINEYEKIDK